MKKDFSGILNCIIGWRTTGLNIFIALSLYFIFYFSDSIYSQLIVFIVNFENIHDRGPTTIFEVPSKILDLMFITGYDRYRMDLKLC